MTVSITSVGTGQRRAVTLTRPELIGIPGGALTIAD